MQLPPTLRQAIDRELHGIALTELSRAAAELSQRYRAEIRDGRFHLDDELAAKAYLTTRLPATFAAIAASFAALIDVQPAFQPRSILDVGAGPGTATWAAAAIWDSLVDARLIEPSPAIRAIGERLSRELAVEQLAWREQRVDGGLPDVASADLVVLAYVLDELEPALRVPLIERLWSLSDCVLVIVEPGTTEGWKRILAARDALIKADAHLLAPCPHAKACPLAAPDWCHFAARVARSRLHREAKSGTVPWEDEKFIYLAAARQPGIPGARIIAPARRSKADVTLKLCQVDGSAVQRRIAKRDGAAFKQCRKLDWGDKLMSDPPLAPER